MKRESRLPYMPGIDGLRAVAVLAVFFYHVNLDWMSGGWLGVDLFFVISGFLITSLLLREYEKNNHINVLEFWFRRARRLLPAVVVMISVVMVLALLFARDSIDSLRGDAIAGLLYVENWHLIFTDQSYFETFVRPSLLRHLWSLSVEEQFYLIWPIVFAFGLTQLNRTRLLGMVIAGILASTLLMILLYSPTGDVTHAFYGTDTRAAALLVGVALALVWTPGEIPAPDNKRLGLLLDVVGAIALFMVIRSLITFNDFDPSSYEGGLLGFALWCGIVIGACAHPATQLNRVLGAAPLLWLGLRSYSFYLWHWPIVTLTRPELDVPIPEGILIPLQLGVTLLLAHLSYEYIEQPFRRKRGSPSAPPWLFQGRIALAAGVVFTVLVIGWGGFDTTGEKEAAAAQAAAIEAQATPDPTAGRGGLGTDPATDEITGNGVLAIGDSVMLASQSALAKALGKNTLIDAVESRQAASYPGILAAYRNAGQMPDTVVIQVGNNGPVYSEDFQAIRDELDGVDHVFFINVEVPRSWEEQVNKELGVGTADWPEATVIDWQSAIAGLTEDTYDGIHPTPEGAKIYANLVADAVAATDGTESTDSSGEESTTTDSSSTTTTTTSTTG